VRRYRGPDPCVLRSCAHTHVTFGLTLGTHHLSRRRCGSRRALSARSRGPRGHQPSEHRGVYGLEKTPDVTALLMELVEGEDLETLPPEAQPSFGTGPAQIDRFALIYQGAGPRWSALGSVGAESVMSDDVRHTVRSDEDCATTMTAPTQKQTRPKIVAFILASQLDSRSEWTRRARTGRSCGWTASRHAVVDQHMPKLFQVLKRLFMAAPVSPGIWLLAQRRFGPSNHRCV